MRSSRLQRIPGFSSMLFVTLSASILFASSPAFAQPADGPSTAFAQTQHSAQQVRQAWVARYNSSDNGPDVGRALAVDKHGNIYVTGEVGALGPATDTGDYATFKYSPTGQLLWVQRYNGPGNSYDYPYAIAVDAQGNVYVTGDSRGSDKGNDYATLKYDPDGNLLWEQRYNGPASGYDSPAALLVVDKQGSIYVTGGSEGNSTGRDYTTLKYNSNGTLLWEQRYNDPNSSGDFATALAVDEQGNIYVTGLNMVSGGWNGYATTLKYNPQGNLLWVQRYNGPGDSGDYYPHALAVDRQGNAYVTGESCMEKNTEGWCINIDYVTLKYDSNGSLLWAQRYSSPGNGWDFPVALAVDKQDNAYVTGYIASSSTGNDYATLKYDPDGNLLWEQCYNGPGNDSDKASALAIDNHGNVYVAGYSVGSGTGSDYATLKYDPNGNLLWEQRYNSPGNRQEVASTLAVDEQDNVYVTGYSSGSWPDIDVVTIKYSQ